MLLKFSEYPAHLHYTIPALGVACALLILAGLWLSIRSTSPRPFRIAAVACFLLAAISGIVFLISLEIPEMIW